MQSSTPASQPGSDPFATGVLQVQGLGCSRGDQVLFDALEFRIEPSGVLLIEGPNGSGKTTLLRAICGLVPIDAGRISWNDRAVETAFDETYRDAIAYVGHASGIKEDLTAAENLTAARALGGGGGREGLAPTAALEQLGLGWAGERLVRRLSAGQRRRVALARLLTAPAPLWILDEPLAALDTDGKRLLETLISEHASAGGLTLISTHQPLALPDVGVEHLYLAA